MTNVKRHPIRGLIGGLFLGLAIAQLLIVFKVVVLGSVVPVIVVVVVTVLGVVWALYGPVRRRKGEPAMAIAAAPASGPGPMPDASVPTAGEGPMPD